MVVAHTAVGDEQMVALKRSLMPTDGSKRWNHVPNATSVYEDAASSRTYAVEGMIQSTFVGGNCSQA